MLVTAKPESHGPEGVRYRYAEWRSGTSSGIWLSYTRSTGLDLKGSVQTNVDSCSSPRLRHVHCAPFRNSPSLGFGNGKPQLALLYCLARNTAGCRNLRHTDQRSELVQLAIATVWGHATTHVGNDSVGQRQVLTSTIRGRCAGASLTSLAAGQSQLSKLSCAFLPESGQRAAAKPTRLFAIHLARD